MTTAPTESRLVLADDRFSRFAKVEWWDQAKLRNARVLVVGAGALGNEVIKNLALLGVGHLTIVDRDVVEMSNLSRSALFRSSDAGSPKAECAARAAADLYPDIQVDAIVGDVTSDVGFGHFRRANAIVGALDNREARIFVNSACARLGRPWIDGGIEVLQGVVRGFAPPATACYECTMSEVDWQVINRARSCSMLARRALAHGGTPTTPTTASVIGAIQAQEVVKLIHDLPALLGEGFVFEGAAHSSFRVSYPINPDCPWHDEIAPISVLEKLGSATKLEDLITAAEKIVGRVDSIELGREIVERLECVACGRGWEVLQPLERLHDDDARCASCGGDSVPTLLHSIARDSRLISRRVAEIGLPRWEIVWARSGDRFHGLELGAG